MADVYKGITVKIGADTTDLNSALKGTNKNISDTEKQLKQVENALKLDPSNVELLRQKMVLSERVTKSYADKIGVLNDAIKNLDTDKFNENSDVYMLLQRDIQKTTSKLKNLEKETNKENNLVKTGKKSVEGLTTETQNLNLQSVITSASILAVITKVVDGLKDITNEVASTADELNSLSATTMLTTEQLQQIAYSADLVGVSMSTYRDALAQVNKQLEGAYQGNMMYADAFDFLGVAITNADGSMRDSSDVFYDCIDALGKIEDITLRDQVANELFGQTYENLNPLIQAGGEKLKSLADEALSTGYVMSGEALKSAQAYQDALDNLNNSITTLKQNLGILLIPTLTTSVDEINRIVTFMNEAKMETDSFKDSIGAFFDKVKSFNMGNLADSLFNKSLIDKDWFQETFDDVVAFFKKLTNTINEFFTETFTGWIKDIGKWGKNLGYELIKGLLDFVECGINTLLQGISTVTEFLGLGSLGQVDLTSWLTSKQQLASESELVKDSNAVNVSTGDTQVSISFEGSLAQLGAVLEPTITQASSNRGKSLTKTSSFSG